MILIKNIHFKQLGKRPNCLKVFEVKVKTLTSNIFFKFSVSIFIQYILIKKLCFLSYHQNDNFKIIILIKIQIF